MHLYIVHPMIYCSFYHLTRVLSLFLYIHGNFCGAEGGTIPQETYMLEAPWSVRCCKLFKGLIGWLWPTLPSTFRYPSITLHAYSPRNLQETYMLEAPWSVWYCKLFKGLIGWLWPTLPSFWLLINCGTWPTVHFIT